MPRILTYNIHRCLGTDRRTSPERIADVIAATHADIVCLQEVDVGRKRSGGIDQAHVIGEALGMNVLFHPSLEAGGERYGNAILTSAPVSLVKAANLPGLATRPKLEPRSVMWAKVRIAGLTLEVFNTHLGLRGPERLAQINALMGHDWLGHRDSTEAMILAGDFNATPRSVIFGLIREKLRDARSFGLKPTPPTFHSRFPLLRLDHVFVNAKLKITRAETIRTPLTRAASDHLPLLVECHPAGKH